MSIRDIFLKAMYRLVRRDMATQIATAWLDRTNRQEYEHPHFSEQNERPVEYRFVFEQIAAYYPKSVLDVGTGVTAVPHVIANCGCRVTAIDNIHDYWPRGLVNRHYLVLQDDIVATKLTDRFDMVICVSALEHIARYDQAVAAMVRLLADEGRLVLTFPYNEEAHVDNVYELPGSSFAGKSMPYKTAAFSRSDLDRWQNDNPARILKQEYWHFFDGDHWTQGRRLLPPVQVQRHEKHQLSCVLLEKRCGR